MLEIILILLLGSISAVLYRAGGMDKQTPYWIPVWLRQSWVRDWLCPACIFLALWIQGVPIWNWQTLLAYGLTGGALSTYWGWLNPLFGKEKKDKYWWNWLISGCMVGLAAFPLLSTCPHLWAGFVARIALLGVFWAIWCEVVGNDHVEEFGRGASITTSVLLIGG